MSPQCRFCKALPEEQSIKGAFVYGGKNGQHFWQCKSCQMIYLDPPLTEEEEMKFYKSEFEKFMEKRSGQDMDWTGPEKHFQINQREVDRRMPFLKPYLQKGQKILEIGCSSGFMLSALKEKGVDVFGIELSGGFIDYVRSKDIEVFSTLEQLLEKHDIKFDLIIHYFVLEHIRNPVEFIAQYMDLLNARGKMIFDVPCALDPLVELYKVPAFDKFYWSIAHHWYFNKESLNRVLEKTGYSFELYPDQRYDMSNHMTWMIEGKPGGRGRYNHIFNEGLNNAYKEQLKINWLCDTITAVIPK